MAGVIGALKHYNLLYPTPSIDLEAEKTLCQHVLTVLYDTHCPLCNVETVISSVHMPLRGNKTAVLTCTNPKCAQKSIWEYEKNKWLLKAPYKYSFTPQTVIDVPPIKPIIPQLKEPEEEMSISFE